MITINTIELLFSYEDGYCYKYRSYDKAAKKDDEVYLCSYIRNLYYNCKTEKQCYGTSSSLELGVLATKTNSARIFTE